jgi:hypothetical protein
MKQLFLFFLSMLFIFSNIHAQQGRGHVFQRMIEKRLDKKASVTTGPIPDYSQLYYWAASPYKHNCSDSIPAFLKNEVRDSSADVFFIHPTTFIGRMKTTAWNADLTDTAVNRQTDLRPILYQASVFNGSCRIFAPRYRQANLKAFYVINTNSAQQAFDTAYSDIKHAFQYYLDHDNHGRPIIIASHSQGSLHAIYLLHDFFDGKPLQKQLVCAYVVGYRIEKNAFTHIPFGSSPAATGCVVGWRSFREGTRTRFVQAEKGNSLCVNPITWTTSLQWASPDLNEGAVGMDFNKVHPHVVGAGIDSASHVLWVTFSKDLGDNVVKRKNLHIADYNLFWMNIRENVKQRIAAYQQKSELSMGN